MKYLLLFLFLSAPVLGFTQGFDQNNQEGQLQDELETVPYVNLGRYVGTWYQIARNPIFFETGCVCSRQVLTPQENGTVSVYNTCNDRTPAGELKEIRGTAEVADPVSNAKLIVDFNLPFKGDYWIIGLDRDYTWAVVSDPKRQVLYVLSKTPTLAEEDYSKAVQSVSKKIDTTKLTKTLQQGCSYPTLN